MSLFGAAGAASNAKQSAQISQNIAGDEEGINDQKRQQMEMSARRQNLETLRNAQRQRSQATASAVNQGANMGSGIQGGLGQITDQTGTNLQGVNQNLAIGENIFNYNDQISEQKKALANVQSSQATDTALMSLGNGLVSSASTIGNIGKFAGGGISDFMSLMSPGSISGGLGKT